MEFLVLLTFVVISLSSVRGHAIESPAEAYWIAKLGNTPMPKVVKNALNEGSPTTNSKKYDPTGAQVLVEGLSTISTKKYDPTGAQVYAEGLVAVDTKKYNPTGAQVYAKELPTISKKYNPTGAQVYAKGFPTSSKKYDPTGAQVYSKRLPSLDIKKYDPTGAQVYPKGLLASTKKYDPTGAQVYAKGLPTSRKKYDPTGAQVYFTGHSSMDSKKYDPTGAQVYAKGLPRSNKKYDPTGAQVYAKGLPTGSKKFDLTGAQVYSAGLPLVDGKKYDPTGAQVYAKGFPTSSKKYDPTGAQVYAKGLPITESKKYDPTGAQVYAQEVPSTGSEFLNDDSVLFFFEKDLRAGKTMKLHFITSDDKAKFLPLEVAKSIPFSYGQLPKIMKVLSVNPNSADAKVIEKTIETCEARAVKGEDKYCATSLEDMVDYVTSNIGNKAEVLSTAIDKETTMEYKVEGVRKIRKDVNLVCHKMRYPYAVFYCHNIKNTDAYAVSLSGSDGKNLKAVAVCHEDTSSWEPTHLAFQLLQVKPGSVPICHFLYEDSMIWVPKN